MKNKRGKQNFLKQVYSQSWNYIKESKNYIWFIITIFILSAILAFFYHPPEIIEAIKEFIRQLIMQTQGLNTFQMIMFILQNNFKSSLFGMILGIILGIFPVITAFANGYLIGFVSMEVMKTQSPLTLLRLLPHGIFEIPAIILSLALGTKLGTFIFAKDKKQELIKRLSNSLNVFLYIIIPLLIIAAIIEGILIIAWP